MEEMEEGIRKRVLLNFKHDEAVVLNNNILINGKAVGEDIAEGEKEMREME